MKGKTTTVGWFARIICILAIAFVSIFALDAFESGTIGQKLIAFSIHMIPSAILALILLLAWKRELLGGIAFIIIGAGLALPLYFLNFNRWHSVKQAIQVIEIINLPFVLIGALFLLSYYQKKRRLPDHTKPD